jgi:hypothetical protein
MAKKKDQMTNKDLENRTQKTKDRTTRIPLKNGVNSAAPGGWAVPAPRAAAIVSLFTTNLVISHE